MIYRIQSASEFSTMSVDDSLTHTHTHTQFSSASIQFHIRMKTVKNLATLTHPYEHFVWHVNTPVISYFIVTYIYVIGLCVSGFVTYSITIQLCADWLWAVGVIIGILWLTPLFWALFSSPRMTITRCGCIVKMSEKHLRILVRFLYILDGWMRMHNYYCKRGENSLL